MGSDGAAFKSLLNIIFRKYLEANAYTRIFDNYYDLSESGRVSVEQFKLSNYIEIFTGIVSDITERYVNGQPSYCLSLDPAHKVISKERILPLIYKLWDAQGRQHASLRLKGTRVMTIYNHKSYGIEGIDFKLTPKSVFERTNRKTGVKEEISFAAYMKESGHRVTDMDQPLLIATGRGRQRIHLLPEFCVPTVINRAARAKLPQITSLKPIDRQSRIQQMLKLVTVAGQSKAAAALSQYGLQIGTDLIVAQHSVLPSPSIVFAPQSSVVVSSEWRKEASNVKFSNVPVQSHLKINAIIFVEESSIQEFAADYWKSLKSHLVAMKAPIAFISETVQVHNKGDYISSLETAASKLPKNHDPKRVFVAAFLSKSSVGYNAYRQFCNDRGYVGQAVDASIPSQDRKLDKRNHTSILDNIARQIVNKFGHLSWWMDVQTILPKHANKQFLFIGIDVFHDAPKLVSGASGSSYWQRRSIAAYNAKLVAGKSTLQYCDTDVRDAGAEVSGQHTKSKHASHNVADPGASHVRQGGQGNDAALGKFVKDALEHWKQIIKPTALVIIVYRDGVADSQLDQVDEAEVSQLKEVVPADVHLIYSIVQKRVHNRFVIAEAGGRYQNCTPGTVVTDLARVDPKKRENFFLVPCSTNLSTNKPVNYTITYNSHPEKISLEEFQTVSFASHHLYQNWAGTVKVPDVCQNAHKLAYTLGESGIERPNVHELLKETMFFL